MEHVRAEFKENGCMLLTSISRDAQASHSQLVIEDRNSE